jgi:hypothetical protein
MKYILIWWIYSLLDHASATGSADFKSYPACTSAGITLTKEAATNGRDVRYLCVPEELQP